MTTSFLPQAQRSTRRAGWRGAACVLGFLAWCTLVASPVHADDDSVLGLRMRAQPTTLTQGETFTLEVVLTVRGQDSVDEFETPDLTDFTVLNESEAQQASVFARNGRRQIVVEHKRTYLVRADEPGTFHVGEATAVLGNNSARAAPIDIKVKPRPGGKRRDDDSDGTPSQTASTSTSTSADASSEEPPEKSDRPEPGARFQGQQLPSIFLEVVPDKMSAYVGEQVTVIVEVWSTQPLGSVPRVPGLKPKGFSCLSIDDGARLQGQMRALRGRNYYVYPLTRDALFALDAGEKDLGALSIDVNQGGSFFRAGREVKLTTPPVTLTIKPLPPADASTPPVVKDAIDAGAVAGNVGTFRLSVTARPTTTKVGEPFTLVIEASGYGNIDALTLPVFAGDATTRLFPPTLKRERRDRDGVIAGRVVEEVLVQPQAAQDVSIPGLTLVSFSPAEGRYVTSTSPPFSVRVQGSKAVAGAPTAGKKSSLVAGPRGVAIDIDVHGVDNGDGVAFAGVGVFVTGAIAGGIGSVRRRRRSTAQHHAEEVRRARTAALAASSDLAFAQAALTDALAEVAGASVRATPISALPEVLTRAGMAPALAERVTAALNACEAARYSPAASVGRIHADVVAVVDDVHAHAARGGAR